MITRPFPITQITSARFDGAVEPIAVHEDEATAFKFYPVVAQVKQRCKVECLVRLLVNVRMPVFVVHRLGRLGRHLGEKRGRSQVNGARFQLKVLRNGLLHLLFRLPNSKTTLASIEQ